MRWKSMRKSRENSVNGCQLGNPVLLEAEEKPGQFSVPVPDRPGASSVARQQVECSFDLLSIIVLKWVSLSTH